MFEEVTESYKEQIANLKKELHRYKDSFNKVSICNQTLQKEIDRLRKENEDLMGALGVKK